MAGYILSVLGIVIAGIFIDIILPNGSVNKYIKSVYAIFVVAVLISPIVKFLTRGDGYTFQYDEYELNESLMNYIFSERVKNSEATIKNELSVNLFNHARN